MSTMSDLASMTSYELATILPDIPVTDRQVYVSTWLDGQVEALMENRTIAPTPAYRLGLTRASLLQLIDMILIITTTNRKDTP